MSALDQLVARARTRRRLPPPEVRRLIRERARVSQEELAQALEVSRTALTRWEGGTRCPQGANLDRYLEALDRLMAEE